MYYNIYYRKALEKECEQHHRDIEFLQGCLYGDNHNQDYSLSSVCSDERSSTEPTLRGLCTLYFAFLKQTCQPNLTYHPYTVNL